MIPKFRGISIDDDSKGKMQYGYPIADGEQAFIINEVVEANEQYITIGSWCPVDQKTIGQSTGLKDKNGKEIFEGDIIANGIDIVDIKRHQTLGFYTIIDGIESFFGNNISIEGFEKDVEEFTQITEIIGNIYENPELFEVE